MQPNTTNDRVKRDPDVNDDQYRRPSCGRRQEAQSDSQTLGPGTAQLLHLLNTIGV